MEKVTSSMRRAFIALIRLYQVALSPMLGNNCRFQPTCSQYSIQAIETHGVLVGSYLTIKRILRCQPLCKGGYDPVPPKGGLNHSDMS